MPGSCNSSRSTSASLVQRPSTTPLTADACPTNPATKAIVIAVAKALLVLKYLKRSPMLLWMAVFNSKRYRLAAFFVWTRRVHPSPVSVQIWTGLFDLENGCQSTKSSKRHPPTPALPHSSHTSSHHNSSYIPHQHQRMMGHNLRQNHSQTTVR